MRVNFSRVAPFFLSVLLIVVLLSISSVFPHTRPVLNKGQKWRIGFHEGGSFIYYPVVLKEIVKGLVDLGWLEPIVFPEFDDPADSRHLWDFLVRNVKSDYIEFVQDAYWSSQWSKEIRSLQAKDIIERLNVQKDIDFMIAAGTWAGQDLANNSHSTPTMAISVSDAVKSNISIDYEHSGLDHFHVRCDPDKYVRQIRLFHRLVNFKKLGIVYENSVEGKSYSAFEEIVKASKERNFSLITCEVPGHSYDLSRTTDEIVNCHEILSREVDAFFVTVHPGMDPSRMKELVAPFLAHKIPTWSQQGPDEVRRGLLFSTTKSSFEAIGKYHAGVMARVFNGETIGNIGQIFSYSEFLAVNKKVAEFIGYDIPSSILTIADRIYDRIEYE